MTLMPEFFQGGARESRCIWRVHFRHLDMHNLSHSDSSSLRSTKLFTASQLLSELLLHYTCLLLAQGCVFGVDKSLTLTALLGGYVEREDSRKSESFARTCPASTRRVRLQCLMNLWIVWSQA